MDEFRGKRTIRDSVDHGVIVIWSFTVSRTKHFWAELSPTPNNIFYLDFFLCEGEVKLNWGKILVFGETFLKISKII